MAAQKTSEGVQGSVNNVIKSKRRRFQDDDGKEKTTLDCQLKELLAKELSDFLERTIEEVEICDEDDKKSHFRENEPTDDFQLFSTCQQKPTETLTEEKQNCFQKDTKAPSSSSEDEDDDETKLRLREAAVSVQDIFGPQFNQPQFNQIDSKTV